MRKEKSSILKLLFIINPGSGNRKTNLEETITTYFEDKKIPFETHELQKNCSVEKLKDIIQRSNATRVIAVGGDGTLKLVAECLLGTDKPIGIIPAGSANGMAKELGIPLDIQQALDVTVNGSPKKIHAVMINEQLCIHLADIGFNAYIVKKFGDLPGRGMLGYAKAAWKALWTHNKMDVEFKIENNRIRSQAAMVVIANATMYGTGVKINPEGKLDDELFEIILVKNYSALEILKIWATKLPFNPKNIESFQTSNLEIKTRRKAHFQVDGEYIGRVNILRAHLIPNAIQIIV